MGWLDSSERMEKSLEMKSAGFVVIMKGRRLLLGIIIGGMVGWMGK